MLGGRVAAGLEVANPARHRAVVLRCHGTPFVNGRCTPACGHHFNGLGAARVATGRARDFFSAVVRPSGRFASSYSGRKAEGNAPAEARPLPIVGDTSRLDRARDEASALSPNAVT